MAEYKAIIDDRAGAPTHGKWVVTHADGPRVGCLASLTGYASRDSAMRRIRAMKAQEKPVEVKAPIVVVPTVPTGPRGVYPAVSKREYRRRWAA